MIGNHFRVTLTLRQADNPRSFHLKIANREEGPYEEAQVAQMFADGRVDRRNATILGARRQLRSVFQHRQIVID